jgi:5-methylcytosine-specific restriction enzyme B
MATQSPRESLEQALATLDRAEVAAYVAKGREQRAAILERFPVESWPELALEKYALGTEQSEDSYCRWLEFGSPNLGSIRGGASQKLLIFRRKAGSWWYDDVFPDEAKAWGEIRAGYVEAFELAKRGEWEAVDEIAALRAAAIAAKSLHVYFPDDVLPVFSRAHLRHYLKLLGAGEPSTDGPVGLGRLLLAELRKQPALREMSTSELERLLYHWADPREARQVVKIAPGEIGRFWDDCLAGGYICVGWDRYGDLREYEDKAAFRARFDEISNYATKAKRTAKANELWRLMELEPGDLIIANKGTSHILAVGEVIEPGYEWMPERDEFKHTVRVKWNTEYAQDIEPVKSWATVTVAKVPAALYEQILERKGAKPVRTGAGTDSGERDRQPSGGVQVPADPVFREIAGALARKGQVILYGPPGTGKTYSARRFALHWLLSAEGHRDPAAVLADPDQFAAAERRLSTAQVERRVWWVVANPKQWSWDQLFDKGSVLYRYGRLRKNYPLVRAGDLVIGYQSNPDKRIVALARATAPFGAARRGEPGLALEPVQRVTRGLSYEELGQDPILAASEPMRFHNQGTLFALSQGEAERLLALLAERDPSVAEHLDAAEDQVGPITRITFHPSYSYEDFVEGFRPVKLTAGGLNLELVDGVFKRVCLAAQARPDQRFLILIDEINRSNVAKVFGELITLLEKDKRGLQVVLPQSRETFAVPENVYVLGTMNTADRSIKLLDAALRRRFAFIEVMPDPEHLRGAEVGGLALDEFLEELNRRVLRREGREKQIGHSFLMDGSRGLTDAEEFARRFRHEILPLLQEYCYADYAALAGYLGREIVDPVAHSLDEELLGHPERLTEALARALTADEAEDVAG